MSDADKTTMKLRPYPGNAGADVMHNNLTEEQNNTLELVKKTAQLKEEMKKSLELQNTIEELQQSLEQEKAGSAGMADQAATLEAKEKRMAELEAKVRELTEALGKISGIAAAGKSG